MSFQDPKIEIHGNSYRIRVRVPVVNFQTGRLERVMKPVVLGRVGELSATDAKKEKQRVLATINAGAVVSQAQLPFSLLADKFEAVRIPQLGARTREKYLAHLKNHIRPALGEARICDIDRFAVEALLAAKASLSSATRADIRNIISAVFEQARAWRLWSGENPARGAEIGRGGPVRPKRSISREAVQQFIAALPETEIVDLARARLIVLVAIVTALRVSEILGLRYSDLDAKARTITVSRRVARGDVDDTKTKASRRTRFFPAVADLLAQRGPGEPIDSWIFERGGEPLDDRDLQQHIWRPAAEAVGIYHPGFGLHTLRRLSITWRQQEGATAIEAMKFGGHTSLDMTMLYTLEDERREREVTERIARSLEGPTYRA